MSGKEAESCMMFERLFMNAPDAVVVADNDGVIRKVNQQVETLFGYAREELIGKHVEILIPGRFHEAHRHHRAGYFADPRTRKMGAGLELFGRNRDGREIPVDIMLSPIETSEGMWAFAVVRDITQRKQDEAKITALNAYLEKQVEQLTAANLELEDISYSISHNLRAPLRHISSFLQLLSERALPSLDDKSRHYLEVITEAGQKMGVLIDDLLGFSRMRRIQIKKTRVDFDSLVKDVINELTGVTKERDITWVVDPLPVVVGDYAMLRQVMFNLISNAVKFSRSRSQARIDIGALTDRQNETLFYVRDNGVGFDMKYSNKLFGLFERLHNPEEFEGTGVGLANAQRIIVRHGGRIWAEGAVDGGATFWFSLPKTEDE